MAREDPKNREKPLAGEDLKNRVEWLDEERRKDKASLAKLEERLANLTGILEFAGQATAGNEFPADEDEHPDPAAEDR